METGWGFLWNRFNLKKTFFVQINFHSLLCTSNETNNTHSSSSFFTQQVSCVDLCVTNIFKKGLLKSEPFLFLKMNNAKNCNTKIRKTL
jgi:hypothetical protein